MTEAEMIEKLKAVLEVRPKHVLEDVAKRSLEDRASYFGSEISNFFGSENTEQVELVGEIVEMIAAKDASIEFRFTDGLGYICLTIDGKWTKSRSGKLQHATAFEVALCALESGCDDPVMFILEEAIRICQRGVPSY